MTLDELRVLVRTVPDFPKPGILFRDVTTLMGDGAGFRAAIAHMSDRAAAAEADVIAGIDARGFIFGAAIAAALGLGFIPVRKPGKLPVPVLSVDYALEYGTGTLEIDPGMVAAATRIVLVDDLIATGGTALAAAQLLRRAGGRVASALFVIDLPDLGGADRLRDAGVSVDALLEFDGH
ncbi:adenine phosphoribosyltransferase [Novosphingobium sp. Leaf2]|uniref:adenine phosphoribosyltransferase n=1 Tax=Novosphingobium sp. Leaf2 TaxID=1735670 RepID=UPI0006F3904C|nr:adenine phosphoribosyltransferase [Novosphingobium sp. Leaf2]KQM21977.1 adenine phosphoribosyltransferase [Novosphingobium sp. Leaf2]